MKSDLIPNIVYKELEFIKKSILFPINGDDIDSLNIIYKILESNETYNIVKYPITFVSAQESLRNYEFLENLYNLINKYSLNCLILSASSTLIPYGCNPLTNLVLWNVRIGIRNTISWKAEEVNLLERTNFKKIIKEYDKSIKGILSVRKQTQRRDYLFSKIKNYDNIICRYGKWTFDIHGETEKDLIESKKFPTHAQLQNEYKSSIFSFIVESESGSNRRLPSALTEKTITAFLTGTIPIVLGAHNYIKELESMGFKVWNFEFGFENADILPEQSTSKIDYFIKCLENIDKISLEECKNIWKSNIHYLQKNFDIVNELILNEENRVEFNHNSIVDFKEYMKNKII